MIRKTLYALTIFAVILLGFLVIDFIKFSKDQKDLIYSKGKYNTDLLKTQVNNELTTVMHQANAFSKVIGDKDFASKDELEKLIKQKSLELPQILGVTIAYEPYAWDEKTKLYAPYYDKNLKKTNDLSDKYDYTDTSLENLKWYTGVYTKGAHWVEPYYGPVAKTLISDYTSPFYYKSGTKKGKLKGVVTYTISLKSFTEMIHSLSLGKIGYGFVTSAKGVFLAHPIREYIGLENLKSLIKKEKVPAIKKAYHQILKNETGYTSYSDPINKEKGLFFYDNVPASNWKIGVQFLKEDLQKSNSLFKRKYINISLALSICFLLILASFFNRDFLSVKEIWYLSLFTSAILLGNIFWIGYLQHTKAKKNIENHSPPITNFTSLNTIINSQQLKAKKLNKTMLTEIPTGIYIDRLEFQDSYNVNISGTLWQKYPNKIKDSVDIGFRFPQIAPFAESSLIEEVYRTKLKEYMLIGYRFKTTLYLNLNYSDFPFDKRNIKIEILPKNPTDNLILIPDLKSFTYTIPTKKSGIDSKIKLSGSKILETYFNYSFFTYNTNFGYDSNLHFEETPTLHFNINIKEELITAFITYLIPIFVTLVMIFIFIFATPRQKENQIDVSAIIQGMTAFFFVLIFSHIDLRKNIKTSDLVYMEYFYFITYLIIVLSTYNLITFSRVKHFIFDYKDNLIVKSSFWPLFLLLVLTITLLKFY